MIKNYLKPFLVLSFGLSLTMFMNCSETKNSEFENKNTNKSDTLDTITPNYATYVPIDDTLIVIDSIAGLLNDDELLDYILVCKSQNESETEYDEYDRKSFIYVGQQNGVYKLHSTNIGAVLCKNCGGVFGDPYDGINIDSKKGFSITHYGGSNFRWGILSKFTYDITVDNWVLTSVENSSFSTNDPENVESILLTSEQFGTVYFQNFDVNMYLE